MTLSGRAPDRLAISGCPAPSMLPTRMVEAVAMPNGSATYENSHNVSSTLCASTCVVPAQHPDSQLMIKLSVPWSSCEVCT